MDMYKGPVPKLYFWTYICYVYPFSLIIIIIVYEIQASLLTPQVCFTFSTCEAETIVRANQITIFNLIKLCWVIGLCYYAFKITYYALEQCSTFLPIMLKFRGPARSLNLGRYVTESLSENFCFVPDISHIVQEN